MLLCYCGTKVRSLVYFDIFAVVIWQVFGYGQQIVASVQIFHSDINALSFFAQYSSQDISYSFNFYCLGISYKKEKKLYFRINVFREDKCFELEQKICQPVALLTENFVFSNMYQVLSENNYGYSHSLQKRLTHITLSTKRRCQDKGVWTLKVQETKNSFTESFRKSCFLTFPKAVEI